jgi:hypothetical protein
MIMKNRLSEETFSRQEPRSRQSAGGGLGMGPAARYFNTVEETIAEHPGASLAAAVLIGVLMAWWIKRR